MLKVRNQLAHDYERTFAAEKFQDIIQVYYPLFEKFRGKAEGYFYAVYKTLSRCKGEISFIQR